MCGQVPAATVTSRANIAIGTWQVGDAVGVLRLSQELLPDLVAVLGRSTPVP